MTRLRPVSSLPVLLLALCVLPMAASPLVAIAVAAAGALLLVLTMHLARGIGKLHGLIAKNLLVRL